MYAIRSYYAKITVEGRFIRTPRNGSLYERDCSCMITHLMADDAEQMQGIGIIRSCSQYATIDRLSLLQTSRLMVHQGLVDVVQSYNFV